MNKKYFVFSDVHGFYDELMESLDRAGFDIDNPDHCIISCGDLMDRGPNPRQCLQFVNQMYDMGRAVLVKGNHEVLLEEMLERGYPSSHDYSNGTTGTVCDMFPSCTTIEVLWDTMENDKDYNTYKSRLVDYYETDKHIFVHGWIPIDTKFIRDDEQPFDTLCKTYDEEWREVNDPYDVYNKWDSYPYGARWLNGIKSWKEGLNQTGKTIVIGHYHCSYGWSHIDQDRQEFPQKTRKDWKKSFEPYIKDGLMAIDGCTAYSGIVNVVVIDDGEFVKYSQNL